MRTTHTPDPLTQASLAELAAGRIDASTGRIDPAELDNPQVDDALDDLGALVEKMGGEVHVLPAERMPCRTGVAASFRH